ncbi:MAG: KAP family NTPase [Chamaesiphon sp.]|nr:KAP family NTPase [Chamaesiphon sp.]
MYNSTKTLDSFFTGDDRVMVIKGEWGVGKTYLWDSYIKKRIEKKDLKQIAYSYISLFGKTSLSDIRSSIFQSAQKIASDEKIDEQFKKELSKSTQLLNRIPWIKDSGKKAIETAPWFGWITYLSKFIPYTDKYSGIISVLEYVLVKDYIICFDDLERKGSSLSVREIMGLVDELARQKNCKVILIFNENSFSEEKDKKEFESYREKVVDAELSHNPTHTQNLVCVFPEDHRLFSSIERFAITLDLKNIRVTKKLKSFIGKFWSELEHSDELVINEFVNHSMILFWSYYLRGSALPFEFVKRRLKDGLDVSYILDKKEMPDSEKKYQLISFKIDLSSSAFDNCIIQYLECGYVETSEIIDSVREVSNKVNIIYVRQELRAAWDLYLDSFADNKHEIIRSFQSILSKYIDKIHVREFSQILVMLNDLGEDVNGHMEKYLELHQEEISNVNIRDLSIFEGVNFEPLMDRIKSIKIKSNNIDIDRVAMKIATERGWYPEDIEFLASITQDEFYQWIKGNPANLMTKLKSGLLFFDNGGGSSEEDNEKYELIVENVKGAITKCASENSLNLKRASTIYKINI